MLDRRCEVDPAHAERIDALIALSAPDGTVREAIDALRGER